MNKNPEALPQRVSFTSLDGYIKSIIFNHIRESIFLVTENVMNRM